MHPSDLLLPAAEVNVPYAQKKGSSRTNSGVAPYTGTFGKEELVHLLKRTMFGAKQSDIHYFSGKTLTNVVNELLTVGTPPSPPLKNYTSADDNANVAFGTTWVNAPFVVTLQADRILSLKSWWFGQMLNQGRSIEEKMVLFWQNHFSTELSIYEDARFGYKYLSSLRQHCLGDFKAMVKAITLEPAMLVYLNGYLNTKGAPDENYARELQELFTMGKGPNSQYIEDDVKAAAKVLTGYDRDYTNITYVFNPARHETSNKTFSAFYNNTVITGKSGAAGEQELDDLLTMIFNQDEVANYICRCIYRFFIYYEIDASVETHVIAPLADTFRTNNYQIAPVITQLLMSEHFFDMLNRGCMIKSPIDFMAGFAREVNLAYPTSADVAAQYSLWFITGYYAASMQQEVLDPPSVSGWPAYYQAPAFHELWINSDTLPKRNQITDFLLYSGYTQNGFTLTLDTLACAAQYSDPSDPNILVNEALQQMYTIQVSAAVKLYLKTILLSGQSQDYYWTNAWLDYINNPTDAAKVNIVKQRLQYMFKYIMNLAEYQLC